MTSRSGIRDGRVSFPDSDARWFAASDERTEVVARSYVGCGLSAVRDDAVRAFLRTRVSVRVIGETKRGREIEKREVHPNDRVPRIHEASQCEYRTSVNGDILACELSGGPTKRALEVR